MAHIEHHPENGDAPWVIVFAFQSQPESRIWVAKRTREEAEEHLPVAQLLDGPQWTPEQIAQFRREKLKTMKRDLIHGV